MSENMSEVLRACTQLTAAKKPITVALVKAKLSKPLPLATIFSGIQRFKSATSSKEIEALAVAYPDNQEAPTDEQLPIETLKRMQAQISALQDQVTGLQAEVEALKSK